MSAFVVDTQTMHRILTGFPSLVGSDATAAGRVLFTLNIAAVRWRYPDTIADPEAMPGPEGAHALGRTYVFHEVPVTPAQALKSLQCLIYQCSEGSVPGTALYKTLARIARLADPAKRIEASAAYRGAEWG